MQANRSKASLVITQKDSSVLYHIQETLGFGYVKDFTSSDGKSKFSRYMIQANTHVLLVYTLLNGNLALSYRQGQLVQ